MAESDGKLALVTGASRGIGMEFARELRRGGFHVTLVARGEAQLRELTRELGAATAIAADLADPGAPRRIFESAGAVDVLVNNAGFGLGGAFAELPLEQELEMIQVNVGALTALTKLFLRPMIERQRGAIVNLASTAAFQPGPLMAVYYATKAYVLSFSEALADELRGTGVTVTALCPGPTATGFAARAGLEGSRLFHLTSPMSSAEVARFGYAAMQRGRRVAIPGIGNKLLVEAVRLSPRRVVTAIVRKLQEQRQ